jgi:ribonuclease HI
MEAITHESYYISDYYNDKKKHNKITFYSDSESAIKALEKNECKSKNVLRCKKALNSLNKVYEVKINWVKGHDNVCGNELADMLAKLGTDPKHAQHPQLTLGIKYVHNTLRDSINSKWQERWDTTDTCKDTKSFASVINFDKAYRNRVLNMEKDELHRYIEWTTGHIALNKHLKDIKAIDYDYCRRCENEKETPFHILEECESIDAYRQSQRNINNFLYGKWKSTKRKWAKDYRRIDEAQIEYILDLTQDIAHFFE